MWNNENPNELKQHLSKLTDEELIKIVCEDYADYREEALRFAEAELAARGIQVEDETVEGNHKSVVTATASACRVCQGALRSGVLFAGKELTIFFSDKNEERFVEVLACSQCGRVTMAVDFETDVED